jgi:hypothetical protein
MRRHLAILAIALACSAAWSLEIKGVEVDAPADCLYIRSLEQRPGKFFEACEARKEYWITEVSFLTGRSPMIVKQDPSGVVTSVYVSGFIFQEALDALTIKFGEPSIETSLIQNRLGATFEQKEARWLRGEKSLVLKRHSSRLDSPSLMLSGRLLGQQATEKRIERATKGADNI